MVTKEDLVIATEIASKVGLQPKDILAQRQKVLKLLAAERLEIVKKAEERRGV